MTKTAVAGDIKQTLDAHLHFRTQLSFNFELLRNCATDAVQFIIVPLVYFLASVNIELVKNVTGSRGTYTIDISKAYFTSFVFW